MAADEIIIETTSQEVIEVGVVGPQGPQGPKGDPGDVAGLPLTAQGDTLYRGASSNQRLPIGQNSQVLKVVNGLPAWANESGAVTSVNGATGAVTVAAINHTHEVADVFFQGLEILGAGNANTNGIYVYGGDLNGKGVYYKDKDTFVYWDGAAWTVSYNTNDIYSSAQNTTTPWQVTSWSVESGQTSPAPSSWDRLTGDQWEAVVGQRINPTLRGDAAGKNVGTGANDVAAGNHTHSAATQSVAGFLSAADKTKLDGLGIASTKDAPASGNASSSQVVLGSDTRLTNSRTPTAHTHDIGDISIGDPQGFLEDLGGVLSTDARLSDSRTPTAHAAAHASSGSDPVSPASIGAQSIFETASAATNTGTLTASRAKIWSLVDFTNSSYNLKLPRTNAQVGDIVVIRVASNASWGANSQVTIGYDFEDTPGVPDFISLITISQKGVQYRYQCTQSGSLGAAYTLIDVDTHTHAASAITSGTLAHERGGLEADVSAYNGLVKISGGATSAVTTTTTGESVIGAADAAAARSAISAAAASHTHELTALAATGATNGHVLTANGSGGVTFAAASGGGSGGATNLWVPASAWIPRSTSGAGVDSREIGATNRTNWDEVLFDTTTQEFCQATVVMPSNYNNNTISARFYWSCSTAPSGSNNGIVMGIRGRAFGDNVTLDAAMGAGQTVADTVQTLNFMHVTSATPAVTIDGTPAANKAVQFEIYRAPSDSLDNYGFDVRLLGVEIIFN